MTARVLPTEPGWWWGRLEDQTQCRRVVVQHGALVVVSGGFVMGPVDDESWTWLEPVATPGTVARLDAERDEAQRIAEARRTRIEVLEAQLLESADGWNWGAR